MLRELSESLELTHAQKNDLEKINRELDNFVHTISHDIGSPLMGISWYGSFLKKHYGEKLDKKAIDCLDGICNGATRLSTLIGDLLALTRIANIKNPYEKADLRTLVDHILERLEFHIRESNIEIVVTVDMPVIVCDRIKIGEVIFNLVSRILYHWQIDFQV